MSTPKFRRNTKFLTAQAYAETFKTNTTPPGWRVYSQSGWKNFLRPKCLLE